MSEVVRDSLTEPLNEVSKESSSILSKASQNTYKRLSFLSVLLDTELVAEWFNELLFEIFKGLIF